MQPHLWHSATLSIIISFLAVSCFVNFNLALGRQLLCQSPCNLISGSQFLCQLPCNLIPGSQLLCQSPCNLIPGSQLLCQSPCDLTPGSQYFVNHRTTLSPASPQSLFQQRCPQTRSVDFLPTVYKGQADSRSLYSSCASCTRLELIDGHLLNV